MALVVIIYFLTTAVASTVARNLGIQQTMLHTLSGQDAQVSVASLVKVYRDGYLLSLKILEPKAFQIIQLYISEITHAATKAITSIY